MRNSNGHAVTSVLPGSSDAVQVAKVNLKYPQAPANQSGGKGGPKARQVESTTSRKGRV